MYIYNICMYHRLRKIRQYIYGPCHEMVANKIADRQYPQPKNVYLLVE